MILPLLVALGGLTIMLSVDASAVAPPGRVAVFCLFLGGLLFAGLAWIDGGNAKSPPPPEK